MEKEIIYESLIVKVYREPLDRFWTIEYNAKIPVSIQGIFVTMKIIDEDTLYDIWGIVRKHLKEKLRKHKSISKKQIYKFLNKKPPFTEKIGRFLVNIQRTFGIIYGFEEEEAVELAKDIENIIVKDLANLK